MPDVEQVGFVNLAIPIPHLEMAGGEFCANAARCLAALLFQSKHPALQPVTSIDRNSRARGLITVSGTTVPLGIGTTESATSRRYAIQAPLPSLEHRILDDRPISIAVFKGIVHVLLGPAFRFSPSHWAVESNRIRAFLCLNAYPAVGCIWFEAFRNDFEIHPVVWVRALDCCYYESACGSGTLALATFLSTQSPQKRSWEITQPSKYKLRALVPADSDYGWIEGPVTFLGNMTLDWQEEQ